MQGGKRWRALNGLKCSAHMKLSALIDISIFKGLFSSYSRVNSGKWGRIYDKISSKNKKKIKSQSQHLSSISSQEFQSIQIIYGNKQLNTSFFSHTKQKSQSYPPPFQCCLNRQNLFFSSFHSSKPAAYFQKSTSKINIIER